MLTNNPIFQRDSPMFVARTGILTDQRFVGVLSELIRVVVGHKPIIVNGKYQKDLNFVGVLGKVITAPSGITSEFKPLSKNTLQTLEMTEHSNGYEDNYGRNRIIADGFAKFGVDSYKVSIVYLVFQERSDNQLVIVPVRVEDMQQLDGKAMGYSMSYPEKADWVTQVNSGNSPWLTGSNVYLQSLNTTTNYKISTTTKTAENINDVTINPPERTKLNVYITLGKQSAIGRGHSGVVRLIQSSDSKAPLTGTLYDNKGTLGCIIPVMADGSYMGTVAMLETLNYLISNIPNTERHYYYGNNFRNSFGVSDQAGSNDFLSKYLPIGENTKSFYTALMDLVQQYG